MTIVTIPCVVELALKKDNCSVKILKFQNHCCNKLLCSQVHIKSVCVYVSMSVQVWHAEFNLSGF